MSSPFPKWEKTENTIKPLVPLRVMLACAGFLSWFAFPSHCLPCCNQNGRAQQIPHLSINIRKQVRLDSHKVDGPSKAKTRSVTRNHLGTLSLCDPKTVPNWLTPYENKGKEAPHHHSCHCEPLADLKMQSSGHI